MTRTLRSLAPLLLFLAAPVAPAQVPAPAETAPVPVWESAGPHLLEPFTATYAAWYRGREAGDATMRLVREGGRWRADLVIRGDRGLAGLARLSVHQSTVFEEVGGQYRPLSQSTVREALVFDRRVTSTYDWNAMQARWDGSLKKDRRRPVPLREGDMSGLLINLAVIRDARPGAILHYRFVDGGRVREYVYEVATEPETVMVGDMGYEALRVARNQADGDQTVFWVAAGVPTPVRILQRKDGQDEIDLRLVAYEGA